jgi:hypothetical protein
MTEPTPADVPGKGKSAPAAKVLDVVQYTHVDPVFDTEVTHVGVLVRADKDDQTWAVRPLAHHHLEVDPSSVVPVTGSDVG